VIVSELPSKCYRFNTRYNMAVILLLHHCVSANLPCEKLYNIRVKSDLRSFCYTYYLYLKLAIRVYTNS